MLIGSPFILVESTDRCWKCRTFQRVIALGTSRIDDGDMDTMSCGFSGSPFLLRNIERLPDPLYKWLATHEPHFKLFFSKTAKLRYFTNLCPKCGANFGDHFLYEPGGAFAPESSEEAARLKIRNLPFKGEFEVQAAWVSGSWDFSSDDRNQNELEVPAPRPTKGLVSFLRQLLRGN